MPPNNPTLCTVSDDRAPYIAAKHSIEVMGEVWTGATSDRNFYQIEVEWEESESSEPGQLLQLLAIRGNHSGPEFSFESTGDNGAWFGIRGPAAIYALARVLEELAKRVEADLSNRAAGEEKAHASAGSGAGPSVGLTDARLVHDTHAGRIRREGKRR